MEKPGGAAHQPPVNPTSSVRTPNPSKTLGPVAPPQDTKYDVSFPDLYEASVLDLQAGLDAGHFSSVDLIEAYFARIDEVNLKGPALRAVIETNPSALSQAEALDEERRQNGKRSLLHGIPILLKDNIATVASEGMNTTAGSFSLLGSVVPGDAGVVKLLREAGAIMLGKANLSEFANYRGVASGWSGRGGQCTNAYFPNANPCGSSSGSGVAASIGLAAVTLGTETNGSITCPTSRNNVVGIKPTVGLTSRAGVIPITSHQDSVGPIARSVTDAAIVLSAIAGPDPNDNFTLAQPHTIPDFTKALNVNSLMGKRIGVPRRVFLDESRVDPFVNIVFEQALAVIRSLGATVIDPADLPSADEIAASNNQTVVMNVDFKVQLNAWFQSLPKNPSGVRSLADLIKFNDDNPTLEKPAGFESQSRLIGSEETNGFDSSFFDSLAANKDLGATRGIDAALKAHNLDALVLPAAKLSATPSAIAGYPIITGEPSASCKDARRARRLFGPHLEAHWIDILWNAFSEFDLIGFGAYRIMADREDDTSFPDLYEASVLDLQAGLDAGHFSSVNLIRAYFARIDEVNLKGPALRAVIETNPSALSQAEALDKERKQNGKRGLLHGIPVLLKDNIATVVSEEMDTTAGSFSLLGSVVPDDSGVVKRLRKAGAIILGKANLSEFAHFRGNVASGWSGRGGQCTSAYFPSADPCGSSSGSGVAASIGLAAVTLGTETDGSITCPASHNNVVGIKPTVGLTSRAGVISITSHQDSVGPMTRSVTDTAIVLSVIAGPDPNDNLTLTQPHTVPDFTKALDINSLRGKRIGVPRRAFLGDSPTNSFVNIAFEQALATIRSLGATVVDPANLPSADEMIVSNNEMVVMNVDFKVELNNWFQSLLENPSGVRSLADLIKFNDDNPTLEKPTEFEDQSLLIESEGTNGPDSSYFDSLAVNKDLGATRGIDAALKEHNLDALVLPAVGSAATPSAIAGYPIITVPLGFYPDNTTIGRAGPETVWPVPGGPVGLSFFGTAFSEFDLIGFGYAYEQKTKARLERRAFADAIPKTQLKDIVAGRAS
ncbi:amidase signature domain-containing protein [Infundibulicybe gibba]|nr:amidase signature domain-containing protein [Infundibulicybe gibba]